MYNRTAGVRVEEKENFAMDLMALTEFKIGMTGHITDRIFKNGKLIEERVGENLVVNSFLPLVMSLIKNQAGYSGIQYWAVGSGASSWDTTTPNPLPTETQLTNEIGRVVVANNEIVFLSADLNVSATPTNIIQIKHLFGANDCNGTWREFGIFGGNATATANSGLMINKRHHGVLTKTTDMNIERTMRFTLTLA